MGVTFLDSVFAAPGPYATVCVDVTGRLKGRALVVASDGAVVLDRALIDAPPSEVAEWSPSPDLKAVLRSLPGRVPHVVAVVDRVVVPSSAPAGNGPVAAVLRYTDASTSTAD